MSEKCERCSERDVTPQSRTASMCTPLTRRQVPTRYSRKRTALLCYSRCHCESSRSYLGTRSWMA
jgi:hypothetical protein